MIPRTATDDSEDSRDVLRLSDPKHLLELLHDKFGQRAAAPDAAAPVLRGADASRQPCVVVLRQLPPLDPVRRAGARVPAPSLSY